MKSLIIMVRPVRFELTAFCSGGKRSRSVLCVSSALRGVYRFLAPCVNRIKGLLVPKGDVVLGEER